jgi:hypothetical protein
MSRKVMAGALAAAILAALCPSISIAQSKAAKIASALSAAPPGIAARAAVMDLPGKDGKMVMLREGSNGWTCIPSEPKSKYIVNNSMCADQTFFTFLGALMSGKPAPGINQVGYSYMLSADDWESNTDVASKAPTADNQWHHVGSHVMIAYPDAKMLEGLPTRPSKNGAYVMWAGTPYAHVMFPVK